MYRNPPKKTEKGLWVDEEIRKQVKPVPASTRTDENEGDEAAEANRQFG
jgi:hypothetical protein